MAKWIFNRYGRATAIDCGDAVYDSCGRFRLWVYDGNLYNMYGYHVGWAEDGVFYDDQNMVIGFTLDYTGHLPSRPGVGGTPGMPGMCGRPARPGFSGEPGRPGYSGWSNCLLEDYIQK